MKISNVKSRQEERCMLLIEDLETGDVKKIYNEIEIKNNKKLYEKDNYIIIKNPNTNQKQEILKILINSGEGDITKAELTQLELMTELVPILTDFQFNKNKKSDVNKLKNLLNDDNEPMIIRELDKELGKILNSIIIEWIDYAKSLSELPKEQQDIILQKANEQTLEDKLKMEKDKIEKMKVVVENANI